MVHKFRDCPETFFPGTVVVAVVMRKIMDLASRSAAGGTAAGTDAGAKVV